MRWFILKMVFDDNLVGLVKKDSNHRALWRRCRARKPHFCFECSRSIESGQLSYRPITNMGYRMKRICIWCIDQAKKETPADEPTEALEKK